LQFRPPRPRPEPTEEQLSRMCANVNELLRRMKEVETDCGALLVSLEVSDLNPIFAFSYGKQSRGNPIDHAVMRCIKERAAKERQQRTVYPGNKRLEPSDESEGRLSKAYYCSDMELYTFQEPCTTLCEPSGARGVGIGVFITHTCRS